MTARADKDRDLRRALLGVPAALQLDLAKALHNYTSATKELARALGKAGLAAEPLLHVPKIEGEPLNLVMVRHGRSVGNERDEILAKKTKKEVKDKYRNTPNDELRLTSKGRWQAEQAGKWIFENLGDQKFSALFCSEYVRATETAGILGRIIKPLAENQGVRWRSTALFGERSWGRFETLPEEIQEREYEARTRNPRHWAPHHGESFRQLENCARLGMGTLHRKYCLKNVLIATHGELITAFCSLIERYTREQLSGILDLGIPNGGIVQFSRVNPDSGEIHENFQWVRMVCPWDPQWKGQDWSGTWRRVVRPEFTSEELLARAAKFEQIYDQPFKPPAKRGSKKHI